MSLGRDVLAPLLLSPTRASSHFHPASNLFGDWDLFHLKPSHIVAEIDETEEQSPPSRTCMKRLSRLKKAEGVAKRLKIPPATEPLEAKAENWETSASLSLKLKIVAESRAVELEKQLVGFGVDKEASTQQHLVDLARLEAENDALRGKVNQLEKDQKTTRNKHDVSLKIAQNGITCK